MSRDDELNEELQAHLRLAIEERVARGDSRDEAERAARRELGNVTHIREVARDQRSGIWIERLAQDVRYGVRALRRTPAFTITAALTLAIAIGANSAVFSVVNGVLLRPLPFREPERLFLVSYLPADLPFEPPPGLVDRQWLVYRDRQRSFERVAGYTRKAATLSGAGEAVRLGGAPVDANFFATLGVSPVLGRAFTADERDASNVIIISDRVWRERFGADPRIVGSAITLDAAPRTVVGVMPRGFTFPAASDFWTPLDVRLDPHNSFILSVIGRLRAGTTRDAARKEVASIISAMPRDSRDPENPMVADALPLKDVLTGKVASSLLVFSGAVAFVLLIACVNVANLLLIRAATRRREMAVRVALGASRMRIARQLLTESTLVGLAGGALGVGIAVAGVRALLAIAPQGRIPRVSEVSVDGWVLAFTLGVSIVTGIAFGLVPALQSAKRPPQEAIAHGARTVGGGQGRLRALLVAAEVALALVLLSGAGLMIKSFVRMRGADKGYDGSRVMTMNADLPNLSYPDVPRQRAFHSQVIEALSRIPGVTAAAGVSFKPMSDVGMMGDFVVEGSSPTPHGYGVDKQLVSAGYFSTMGMRLVRGRDFSATDDAAAPLVIIVSESIARRVWPGSDAVGKRVSMVDDPKPGDWMTVVGVVNDVAQDRSMAKHSAMYFPYGQSTLPWMLSHMTYVVRADAGASVAPAMRAALRGVDASVPAQRLQSMDDALLDVVAEPLFQTRLLATFSFIALLLAAIGTYGVLAYDVAERSREIALRMALGARPLDVIGMVMRRTGALALIGAAVGIAGSVAVTRVLTTSLYDVQPTDPATLGAVVALIVAVALLAGYAPARRASRVSVLSALPQD